MMKKSEGKYLIICMYGWNRVFDFEWLKLNGWGDIMTNQGVIDAINLTSIKEGRYYDSKYKMIIEENK